MDTNDIQFSASINVYFPYVPEGAEEWAEIIKSNTELRINFILSQYIQDNFPNISADSIKVEIVKAIQIECAFSASGVDNETELEYIYKLADTGSAEVDLSSDPQEVFKLVEQKAKEMIEEAVTTK